MWFSFLCQDLNLLDHDLTTSRLMKVIAAERLDPTNLTSCLDEEVLLRPGRLFVPAHSPKDRLCLTSWGVDYVPGIFGSTLRVC